VFPLYSQLIEMGNNATQSKLGGSVSICTSAYNQIQHFCHMLYVTLLPSKILISNSRLQSWSCMSAVSVRFQLTLNWILLLQRLTCLMVIKSPFVYLYSMFPWQQLHLNGSLFTGHKAKTSQNKHSDIYWCPAITTFPQIPMYFPL
jgi:hypothetical protein